MESRVPLTVASALRQVQDAHVEVSVPLTPGSVLPGLSVREGTVARIEADVAGGVVDLANAKVALLPPLDGPLFVMVKGLAFDSDGRLSVRITGFPDLKLGPKLPARVDELAGWLEQRGPGPWHVPVRLWGVRVGSVKVPEDAVQSDAPGTPKLEEARLSISNVTLGGGAWMVGDGIAVDLAPGASLSVEGTLRQLAVTASFEVASVNIVRERMELRGGRGKAEVRAELQVDDEGVQVALRLEHVEGAADSGWLKLRGDDVVRLNAFSLEGASLEHAQRFQWGLPLFEQLDLEALRAQVERFEADVEELRHSFPGTPNTLTAGRTRASGALRYDPEERALTGEVDASVKLRTLHSEAAIAALTLSDAEISGEGALRLDADGVHFGGEDVEIHSAVERLHVSALGGRIALKGGSGSRAELQQAQLQLSPRGELRVSGRGELVLQVEDVHLRTPQVWVKGGKGRMRTRSAVSLDVRDHVALSDGRVLIEADDVHAELNPDGAEAQASADGRFRVKAQNVCLSLGAESAKVEWTETTTVSAEADRGHALLPADTLVRVRRGTQLQAKLSRFALASDAPPELEGAGRLSLRLATEEDLAHAAKVLGLPMSRLNAQSQQLDAEVARVALGPDGRLEVSGLELSATVQLDDVAMQLGD